MSTLAKFGLWQEAQKPPSTTSQPPSADDETRADAGPNHVNHVNHVFSPSHIREGDTHTRTCVKDAHAHGAAIKHGKHGLHGLSQQIRTSDEMPNAVSEPANVANMVSPAFGPVPGSLQARLVAVGATVNTYGERASVRAPDGIPLELIKEVEARGWAIIPGGKPNPEAEHDSWLLGTPAAKLWPAS